MVWGVQDYTEIHNTIYWIQWCGQYTTPNLGDGRTTSNSCGGYIINDVGVS